MSVLFTIIFLAKYMIMCSCNKIEYIDYGTSNSSGGGANVINRDAGILYEVWHTPAAHLMHLNQIEGAPQLTVEQVIRSDGNFTLDNVFSKLPPGYNPDIYNVEPQLGFYCLYRPRSGENITKDTPVCPNITNVARQHAQWLTSAGFDYIVVDITNWPVTGWIGQQTSVPNNDMTILRPLEVLAEEWLALRKQGVPTPSIVAWSYAICNNKMCMGTKEDGSQYAMWRWILDEFYNNPNYGDIIYKVADDNDEMKKMLFLRSPNVPAYNNASFVKMIETNGGRKDVKVYSMWADDNDFERGAWSFFSSCRAPCPVPTPPPTLRPCPDGEIVDMVEDVGDNGSCDCASFCASDWTGILKKQRPNWTGATSAGNPGHETKQCQCVQASHWCPKSNECLASCENIGIPTASNYCVKNTKLCTTTNMVGTGSDCNQQSTSQDSNLSNTNFEVTASGSYMSAQCALPFASPGHLRGLTLQRLFKKVLENQPPHIFLSSFNELIGGRQKVTGANTLRNMGLPYDPQNNLVWVDTYAAEFSRDLEPSKEGGDRIWQVTTSCVQMYKAGKKCEDSNITAAELCCTATDKEIFSNVWSLYAPKTEDFMLVVNDSDIKTLLNQGYEQVCNPIQGPTVFCVDTTMMDARAGPFIMYNVAVSDVSTRPLYRCKNATSGQHFVSIDTTCDGQLSRQLLGYIATKRGSEMLRALRRCTSSATTYHSLDLYCNPNEESELLGFVR